MYIELIVIQGYQTASIVAARMAFFLRDFSVLQASVRINRLRLGKW